MADQRILIEPLDVDNYSTWEFKMKNLLITRDLWAAVEGKGKVDSAEDAKALAQINLSVKEHHFATLRACKSAKEAWDTLAAIYKSKSEARKMALQQELLHLAKSTNEDVTQYVNRARRIRDELLAAGEDDKAINIVAPLLNGLPDDFTPLRLALLAGDAKLTVDDLQTRLINAEQVLNKSPRLAENTAYSVQSAGNHVKPGAGSAAKSGNKRKDVICHFCKKRGHVIAECRKLKALKDSQGSAGTSANVAF